MRLFSHHLVVLAGLGLLAAGCAPESMDEQIPDSPPGQTLGGGDGIHFPNGLLPLEYQSRRSKLDALLQKPLTIHGETNPDHAFGDFFANDAAGAKVFKYAVECALPFNTGWNDFKGAGLMATTASWIDTPLTLQQRRDVHTCITTRLNPLDDHVDVWLGGPDTGKTTDITDYGYSEALWSVDINSDGTFQFSVWPSDTFTQLTICGNTADAEANDFNSRLCENNPDLCYITLKNNKATACTGTPGGGNWMCDGKPAIETRLSEFNWDTMHPNCPIKLPPTR